MNDVNSWTNVFSRSPSSRPVFHFRNTRSRHSDLTFLHRFEDGLKDLGVPLLRTSIWGFSGEWKRATAGFLDGCYYSVTEGPCWGFCGGYVVGTKCLRLACGLLDLKTPRRLKEEGEIPSYEQLLAELDAELINGNRRAELEELAVNLERATSLAEVANLEARTGAFDHPRAPGVLVFPENFLYDEILEKARPKRRTSKDLSEARHPSQARTADKAPKVGPRPSRIARECGSFGAGHKTHPIPATRAYIDTPRREVTVNSPDREGWFDVVDGNSHLRWWYHDRAFLSQFTPGTAKRVGDTTFLVFGRTWIYGSRTSSPCPET